MNIKTIISRFLTPLSLGERLVVKLLLVTFILFSCTREHIQLIGADCETVSVRLNIITAPMQTAGDALTRATTDKTDDELAIHRTWVLQFNGNTDTGRLLKAEEVTFINNTLETELLHTDATCRVYVVANSDCTPFAADAAAGNGISLADFEASLSAFAATQTIAAGTGLPMCGYQDFNPRTDAPAAAFTLKPLVAKFTFKLNIDPGFASFNLNSITLKQVASGTTFKETTANNDPVRPSGITYTGQLDLAGADAAAVTCYLPENLSGRNTALKSMWQRGKENAPENATYVRVEGTAADGNSYAYSFFLGDGTPQDFNIARNYHYSLAATLNGTNDADLRTEFQFIDLNAGGKTANCYLVYGNDVEYAFDATVMGNGATTPAGGFSASYDIIPRTLAPESAKVLWETGTVQCTVISEVKLSADKKKVVFKTSSSAGNAVIAVYDNINPEAPDAKILWSWHIWKPKTQVIDLAYQKYVDNSGILKTQDNYRMMDRNLGATVTTRLAAFGLFYQWGRKDPFPEAGGKVSYGDSFQSTVPSLSTDRTLNNIADPAMLSLADNAACIAYAVEHPTTFFKNTSGWHADWIKPRQDNLWGNPREGTKPIYTNSSLTVNSGSGSKSIYDPCPVGYRVPPSDTWTALMQANGSQYGNGKDDANSKFDATAYAWTSTSMSPTGVTLSFPTCGYINNANGILASVTNYGHYLSSSPCCSDSYEDSAGIFYFFGGGRMNPERYEDRTLGCTVRCVRELD